MESGKIPNDAITASSIWSSFYEARFGRLRNNNCWSPSRSDSSNSWHQVDFGKVTFVTSVATQGASYKSNKWIRTYSISYSNNGTTWLDYYENGSIKV